MPCRFSCCCRLKLAVLFGLLVLIRLRAYTAFLMAITLFSYSEFALIVAAAWADSGLIPSTVLPIIAVAVTLSFRDFCAAEPLCTRVI